MKTVVVTDCKYRASIAAARSLAAAGCRVIAVQTRDDSAKEPPVFSSRCVSERRWIEGSCKDADYPERLLTLLGEYERPVLFPVGAATLNAVARRREAFSSAADFLIAAPETLDALNDKETVHRRCMELSIPVPAEYEGSPETYPVVVKPRCGEKFGLRAEQRYRIARSEAEYHSAMEQMGPYDPIAQQLVRGDGLGASLLLDRDSRLISAICHRRIREYPISGGPTACCVSFYDEALVEQARRLLASFHFTGFAMVEFKGRHVLEVNPRIWGSYPLTCCAGSPFAARYVRAAAGETLDFPGCDYRTGVAMRFLLNDTLAGFHYLKAGKLRQGFGGLFGFLAAGDALWDRADPGPFWKYLKNYL